MARALSLFLLVLPLAAQESRPAAPLARTTGGLVEGELLPGPVAVFRGVPFAAPPVGERRWRPPRPPLPWEGVRRCLAFGPACPQPASPLGREPVRQDEECLFLNIWTPRLEAAARLPVLVWIHGGGMTIGAGSMPLYDGRALAARGAVVVTLNYRLGPLGFLAHPGLTAEREEKVSGNYGLLDQIAALRWVRENIHAFGGDPACITIFGESAGAVSVACLLVSPPAAGLFHRAILQSGTATGIRTALAEAERAGEDLARRLGAAGPAALRAKSPAELLRAAPPRVGLFGPGAAYGPVVDGKVVPAPPDRLFAEGRFHKVPVVIGTNADEATLFLDRLPIRGPLGYAVAVRAFLPEHAGRVLELFPANTEKEVKPALNRLVTAAAFVAPARALARAVAARDGRVWLYHFTRVPPLAALSGRGAAHGLEIPYIFGTVPAVTATAADRRLAAAMPGLWLAFARTGAPAGEGLPAWPAYTIEKDEHLELGDGIGPGRGLWRAECDLVDLVAADRLSRLGGEAAGARGWRRL